MMATSKTILTREEGNVNYKQECVEGRCRQTSYKKLTKHFPILGPHNPPLFISFVAWKKGINVN